MVLSTSWGKGWYVCLYEHYLKNTNSAQHSPGARAQENPRGVHHPLGHQMQSQGWGRWWGEEVGSFFRAGRGCSSPHLCWECRAMASSNEGTQWVAAVLGSSSISWSQIFGTVQLVILPGGQRGGGRLLVRRGRECTSLLEEGHDGWWGAKGDGAGDSHVLGDLNWTTATAPWLG